MRAKCTDNSALPAVLAIAVCALLALFFFTGVSERALTLSDAFAAAPSAVEPRRADSPNVLSRLNRATEAELSALPGVGPTLAARIIEYRRFNGDFQSFDELTLVTGVGEALKTHIFDQLSLSD